MWSTKLLVVGFLTRVSSCWLSCVIDGAIKKYNVNVPEHVDHALFSRNCQEFKLATLLVDIGGVNMLDGHVMGAEQ